MLSGDDGSDNDKYAFQLPDDERLSLLESGSAYSHTDDVINADVQKCFANAKYCALHIHIHNLPILLCETFLNENNAHMFPIPGYSFIHNSRKTRIRGGVAMYILDEFTFRERPDLAINHEGEFESIIAEIEPKQGGKKLMLAEIYRIPNTSQRESIARFESIMTGLQNTNSDIMMGSESYLCNRTQYVSYKGTKSECSVVTHGVPQGSVLGPLLFILYTNDLPNSIKHSKTILFADDTTIYATGNNSADLFEKVNEDLSHLTDWFRANQLSVNASKTKYMLISSKNNRCNN